MGAFQAPKQAFQSSVCHLLPRRQRFEQVGVARYGHCEQQQLHQRALCRKLYAQGRLVTILVILLGIGVAEPVAESLHNWGI